MSNKYTQKCDGCGVEAKIYNTDVYKVVKASVEDQWGLYKCKSCGEEFSKVL